LSLPGQPQQQQQSTELHDTALGYLSRFPCLRLDAQMSAEQLPHADSALLAAWTGVNEYKMTEKMAGSSRSLSVSVSNLLIVSDETKIH